MIQRFGSKGIFILICAVIVAIIIDVSIIRIATSIGKTEITIKEKSEIPYALSLIKQAYERS